uniref:Uncharacterized protein n=1 Tax=Arundo donax TaxID=35708 RepID=A0A0A9G5L2_ARUDO
MPYLGRQVLRLEALMLATDLQ